MIIGNQLFLECIHSDDIDEVTIEDLPAVFTIGPYLVEIAVFANRFVDLMFKKGKCLLERSLVGFFEKNTNAILQIDKSTLAVWKQRNMYHVFDPYSRNNEGFKCRDGTACASMFSTITSMVESIGANFDHKDSIFYLHSMKVCKIHRDPKSARIFPKNMTMNDYPIEDFKKMKMRKGKKLATNRPVTVDYMTRAAHRANNPEESLMEVGSNVQSLGLDEIPPMIHKYPSRSMLRARPPDADFIADLDSPSLSDTQIEPALETVPDEEYELSFVDLEGFDLTQEELELQQRGEGEEGDQQSEDKKSKEASSLEAQMAEEMEEMEGQAEDWYMAASNFTQVGSHSLFNYPMRASAEINTDTLTDIPLEFLPPTPRNLNQMAKKTIKEIAAKYELDVTEEEPEVTQIEELQKDTNFVNLPDGSQIVSGTKSIGQFGTDLELMAPFVCVMAATTSRKYAIYTWSKDIVDYVLKCGAELHSSSHLRYDQVYKLEIPKITLGKTDFSVQVDYVFDSYIKPKVLEMAVRKILFPKSQMGILVTPTYSCTVFVKNHLYYLFDPFANNEVGLSKGVSNEGVACLTRFKDIKSLVARVMHNKGKRESGEDLEYNRFVLSSCIVKTLTKAKTLDEDEDEKEQKLAEQSGEEQVVTANTTETKKESGIAEGQKKTIFGYHKIDNKYKIEGSKGSTGAGECTSLLKEDYFVCLCASLLLLNHPLKKWNEKKIDSCLEQGQEIFSHAEDLDICSKKFIKNILIEDYFFSVVVKKMVFASYKLNKDLKTGIETMLAKKHESFIVQFPDRSYLIFSGDQLNLFDPNDRSGRASWIRFGNAKKLTQALCSNMAKGGESYNFHTLEIMSISKAPREILISNRLKKYKLSTSLKPEVLGRPFNEEIYWLDVEPIPWSLRVDKEEIFRWHHWTVEFADDLYSLFGDVNTTNEAFSGKSRGKQGLACLVVAVGMVQIYELEQWTPAIMDSIVENGDNYFIESVDRIADENYELAMDDLKPDFSIFPYNFKVKFVPVVEGTMFLVRLKQFNLYKALR